TLHHTLLVVARLLAPMTPFVADWLHRALTGGDSVHLAAFPEPMPVLVDEGLESEMDAARMLARPGRAARERVKIRVRQPLGSLYAVVPRAVPEPGDAVLEVVRAELNV